MNWVYDTEDVYKAIVEYKIKHDGNSPTYEQLMDIVDTTSKAIVHHRIGILCADGRLRRRNRRIEVVGGRWLPPQNDGE